MKVENILELVMKSTGLANIQLLRNIYGHYVHWVKPQRCYGIMKQALLVVNLFRNACSEAAIQFVITSDTLIRFAINYCAVLAVST